MLRLGWVLMLWLTPYLAYANAQTEMDQPSGKVTVYYLNDYQEDQQLKIDAQIGFQLTEQIEQALQNEITLTFITELELNEQYDLFGFNATRNRVNIRYETLLRYFSYNKTYLLINQRNKKVQSFSNLKDALRTMGTLDNFKVTDLANLHPTTLYKVQLRMRFNSWALPTPLIINTLFSHGWHLDSGWHKIEIHSPNSWL